MNLIVLIDDEKLTHLTWGMCLKGKSMKLISFYSIDEFINASSALPKTVPIYIDSNLGRELSGEIESQRMHDLGFTNLYLTTGYDRASLRKPSWIKEVYPKDPEEILASKEFSK